jgi:hypothetical protein
MRPSRRSTCKDSLFQLLRAQGRKALPIIRRLPSGNHIIHLITEYKMDCASTPTRSCQTTANSPRPPCYLAKLVQLRTAALIHVAAGILRLIHQISELFYFFLADGIGKQHPFEALHAEGLGEHVEGSLAELELFRLNWVTGHVLTL